ncbi:MAG TPA: phosphatidylglycerol lysyltransferase domain-containing protein [Feifaniaceae bacterium]|nr:phosphatidylglycerol lysyltransferase domain-containing protein [Feifaniaceae bacterium]
MTAAFGFHPVQLSDRAAVEAACAAAGTLSCQYNFANLYCLRDFYGTEIHTVGGALFVRQTRREPGKIAYLPPLNAGWDILMGLAAADKRPWFLYGVTSGDAKGLSAAASGRFRFAEDRDWAEYLYRPEKLHTLSGGALSQKRKDARICRRLYDGRLSVERIGPENAAEVMRFQQGWYAARRSVSIPAGHLAGEDRAVGCALEHFEALGLMGMLIRLDGKAAAYSYGSPVGNRAFDIIAQKADPNVRYLYRVLFQEFVGAYCLPYEYVNAEEDLGLPGLRALKATYHPALLLEKWRAEPISAPAGVYGDVTGHGPRAVPGEEGAV